MSKRGRPRKPSPTSSFADRLKRVRQTMGWSQRDLAKELQLSDKAISSYEVGRSSPTIETLQILGKLTKRPLSYFFGDEAQEDIEIAFKLDRIEDELRSIRKYLESYKGGRRQLGRVASNEKEAEGSSND